MHPRLSEGAIEMLSFYLPMATLFGFIALAHWYVRAQAQYWSSLDDGFADLVAPETDNKTPEIIMSLEYSAFCRTGQARTMSKARIN